MGTYEPLFAIAVNLSRALRLTVAYFYCEGDELADLMLVWGHLSRNERKHIKSLIEAI
jgi:hypothetical protein